MKITIIRDHSKRIYMTDATEVRIAVSANLNRLIIFSDLHIGNGRKAMMILKRTQNCSCTCSKRALYYPKKDFKLILNGDIEELQKFKLKLNSFSYWADLFLKSLKIWLLTEQADKTLRQP